MNRNEITDKLREVMRSSTQEQVDWDAVTEESLITDLGFDSLSVLDLIYDIQIAFEIDFDAEELTNVKTVADMVTFVETKRS